MKKSVVAIGAAVVVLIGVLAVWQLRCRSTDTDDASANASTASAGGAGAGNAANGGRTRKIAAPASVSGRVTRKSDGAPVASAVVSLARAELAALFAPADNPTTIVVTGADGTWRADALVAGTYAIAATAPGLLPSAKDKVAVAPAAAVTGVDFALDAGGVTLRGTVADVGGGGIAGARVTLHKADDMPFARRAELVAIAGPDGKYQMQVLDGTYAAVASHDDYQRAEKHVEIAGAPVVVDFTLVPGGTIRGEVVTREGKPVPYAIVEAGPGDDERGRDDNHTVFADDAGKFTIHGLGPGAIGVRAAARGFASRTPTIVELGIGEPVDGVRVIVDGAYTVSGRLVEKGKSDGIAGVQLGVFAMEGAHAFASDPSAADGSFEIFGVRPNTYFLFAFGEEHMPEIGTPVEVVDHDVTGLVVEMSRGVTLSGRVDFAGGKPAPAQLSLDMDQSKIGLGNMFDALKVLVVRGESDASGAFTLKNVPAGEFTLVATVADGRAGKLPLVVADKSQDGLVVKLADRASIAGRVVDANGAPVTGVHVEVAADGPKSAVVVGDGDGDRGTVTAADGSFKVVGIDGTRVSLAVSDDTGRLAWADAAHRDRPREPIAFDLEAGKARTGVQLVVEARDGWIRGTVVGADGKPAADAWVTAELQPDKSDKDDEGAHGATTPVLTGPDGKFAFERLRKGTYKLSVEGPRGMSRTSRANVRTGETVTLQLERLGTLAGRVTDGARPIGVYDITCTGGGREASRHVVSPDGTYAIERLAPETYKCHVTSDAGTAEGSAEVESGPAKLDFAIAPWATITGVLTSTLDGAPVPGLHVLAGGDAFESRSMQDLLTGKGPVSDASGRFTVPHVGTGNGELVVMAKAGFEPLAKRDYEIAAGQTLDLGTITVVPPRGGTIGIVAAPETGKDSKDSKDAPPLVVVAVKEPADAAGIQIGDVIVAIDGKPVTDPESARQLIAPGALAVGQVVKLDVRRGTATSAKSLTAIKW